MEITKIRFKCSYGSDIITLSIVTGIKQGTTFRRALLLFDDLYEIQEKQGAEPKDRSEGGFFEIVRASD